jgi:hypothetical protein
MLSINSNTLDLSKYRGPVRRCPHCTLEKLLNDPNGQTCRSCLGHGFVASCLNCDGTGMFKGSALSFGGSGDVVHMSTCNPCGGTGMFAVRKPADWRDDVTVPALALPASNPVPDPAITPPVPSIA